MCSNLLSIIIPVYNVEKYLEQCIESIIHQTYRNIEIIFVNDGSTDSSELILDKYKNRDKRIKVIKQENKGLSAARNTGIKYATGDYISFIDSDDYVVKEYAEVIVENMQKYKVDMIIFDALRLRNGQLKPWRKQIIKYPTSSKEMLSETLHGKYLNISAWNKCYKKSLFEQMKFKEGIKFEDYYMTPSLFKNCNNIKYVQKELYIYRDNEDSIMRQSAVKCSNDIIEVTKNVIKELQEFYGEEYAQENLWWCLRRVWRWIGKIYDQQSELDNKEFLNEVKLYLNNFLHYLIIKDKNITLKEKLGILTFCKSEFIYKLIHRLRFKLRKRELSYEKNINNA